MPDPSSCRLPGHDHPATHPGIAAEHSRLSVRASIRVREILRQAAMRGGVLWPDVNHYHPVNDEAAFARSSAPVLEAKATEGTSYVDPTVGKHRRIALDAGKVFLHYGFLHRGNGGDQARFQLAHGGTGKGIVAMGDDEADASDGDVRAYNDAIHAEVGYWPVGYGLASRRYRWSRQGQLYITADYRPGVITPPFADQFTDGVFGDSPHSWPGVGACDMNQLRGTLTDLQRLAGTLPGPTPQPPIDEGEDAWLTLRLP